LNILAKNYIKELYQGGEMLQAAKKFMSMKVRATDGECGHIRDIYFDDDQWTLRYFLLDTGKWLPGKMVLISPLAVVDIDFKNKILDVNLSRVQIENGPNPSEHMPISRQLAARHSAYYDYPFYWPGSGIWPELGYDLAYYANFKNRVTTDSENSQIKNEIKNEDQHLRTVKEIKSYLLEATDGLFGHVEDFVIDDDTWELRYLVVDTINWWPSKSVILSTQWVRDIVWSESKIVLDLSKEKIKNSPAYSEENLDRDYEINLYDYYQEPKYWQYEKKTMTENDKYLKSEHVKGTRR